MNMFFRKFAQTTSELVGSPWAFILGLVVIVSWGATGSIFQYSDTWQLLINTSTTIVTFLMVFVIQHTQNRDAKAIHLKLDELIRGVKGARTEMVALETCTDEGAGRLSDGRRWRGKRRPSCGVVPAPATWQNDRRRGDPAWAHAPAVAAAAVTRLEAGDRSDALNLLVR